VIFALALDPVVWRRFPSNAKVTSFELVPPGCCQQGTVIRQIRLAGGRSRTTEVALLDYRPPESFSMGWHLPIGSGGISGVVTTALEETPDGTRLTAVTDIESKGGLSKLLEIVCRPLMKRSQRADLEVLRLIAEGELNKAPTA